MPFSIPSSKQFPWDEPLSNNLRQLIDGSTGGINIWRTRPTVGVDGQPLGQDHVGYTGVDATTSSLIWWNGSSWDAIIDGDKLVTGTQFNLYVSQNGGNDANDGRTASTAWQSISKFYQEVNKYNLLSKQVNLYLGAGTYSLEFPPTTWGGMIRVYGVSSASVTIQRMLVDKGTTVLLQDVTVAYPQVLDANPFYWPINVDNSSTLQLGPNIVLGPVGNYIAGYARFHIQAANNSSVHLRANCPLTLNGSVNSIFFMKSSTLQVSTYYAATTAANNPNAAPTVDKGAIYTYLPDLTISDTTAALNGSGSISVGSFFNLADGSIITGPPAWKLNVTGNIVGSAYSLIGTSSINGQVAKGSIPSIGIGYPGSISSGTKDSTSTIQGTPF